MVPKTCEERLMTNLLPKIRISSQNVGGHTLGFLPEKNFVSVSRPGSRLSIPIAAACVSVIEHR